MPTVAIESITRKKVKQTTYNFETKQTHNYVANGCVVHNCDTPYTWNFEGTKFDNEHEFAKKVNRKDYVIDMAPEDVAQEILKISNKTNVHRVVFTGGEPLIQQKDIVKVIDFINEVTESEENIWEYEVETNVLLCLQTNF